MTTYRVGMAVPDWPTTFGINMFLYDLLGPPWGVFVEHTPPALRRGGGRLRSAVERDDARVVNHLVS